MNFIFITFFILFSLPGFPQEDYVDMIEEIQEDRLKQTEQAVVVDKKKQNLENQVLDLGEELKKYGHESLNVVSLMDEKVISLVSKVLKQNTLSELSVEEVRSRILQRFKGSKLESFLLRNPRVLDTFVDFVRDDDVIPSALKILLRKDDLKLFGVIFFLYIILALLLKKIFFNENGGRIQRFFLGFSLNVGIIIISNLSFYYIFYDELLPAVRVISKHWL